MEILDPIGGVDCAKVSQLTDACVVWACATTCPVTDNASFQLYQACVQQASANVCQTYAAAAAACANSEADGGAAVACFTGQTLQEMYSSVVPIFCGSPNDGGLVGDGGGD